MAGLGFSESTGMLPMLIAAGDRAELLHYELPLGSALRLEERSHKRRPYLTRRKNCWMDLKKEEDKINVQE